MTKRSPRQASTRASRGEPISWPSWIQACSSVLALLLSTIALYFAYAGHISQAETLTIAITRLTDDYETSIGEFPVPMPAEFPTTILTKWEAALTNASQRGISLLRCDVQPVYPTAAGVGYGVAGIEDLSGSKRFLPVDVEAGKSARILLLINLPIRARAWGLIREAFPSGSRLAMREVIHMLDRRGTDFWDNHVATATARRLKDGSIGVEMEMGSGPRLEFTLTEPSGRINGKIATVPPNKPPSDSPSEKASSGRFVKQPPDRTPYIAVKFTSARGSNFAATAEWY
jgi:hypothetical protein